MYKSPRPADLEKSKQNGSGGPPRPPTGRTAKSKHSVSQYEEAQNDEIEALQSIFMHDFEHVESKTAWSKKSDRSFKIFLRVSSEAATPIPVDATACLCVTLTATYPKTMPLLALKDCDNVEQKTLENMNHVLSSKPKELLKYGEVMILEIANDVERVMRDAVDARVQGLAIPSLEEERVAQEAEASEAARMEEESAAKRQQEERAEEDRTMQRMLEREMRRQEDLRIKRVVSETDGGQLEITGRGDLCFDRPILITTEGATELMFREISLGAVLCSSRNSTIYEASPVKLQQSVDSRKILEQSQQMFALRRARAVKCKAKKTILDLEDNLEKLRSLRHPSIINVYDFVIDKERDNWQFDILTDFSSRGPLADMLRTFGSLPLQRARPCAIELLEALDFYHKNGIVHGSLSAKNVLLCMSSQSNIIFKLADAAVQHGLRLILEDSKAGPNRDISISPWSSPESAESIAGKTRKSDIWDFGVLLVQLVMGLGICERHATPLRFINNAGLSEAFQDLLRDVFRNDPRKRAAAFDIIACEFLRTDVEAVIKQPVGEAGKSSSRRQSTHQQFSDPEFIAKGASRFASEFDEAGHIGKGGFGEVVKARNRLDGRIYAIKKITGKSQVELTEVLSEVRHLAVLNHPYVVRYFQVWQEDEQISDQSSSEVSQATSSSGPQSLNTKAHNSSFDLGHSTGGLDFISSSGYPKIEFGEEDDDYDDEDDEESREDTDENDGDILERDGARKDGVRPSAVQRKRAASSSYSNLPRAIPKSTLFIQMEYCEKRTLRGLINKGICDNSDETWCVFRQILEGLVHIHSFGMIHRDLKPENIFLDVGNNPKIGDFGLATVGQYSEARNVVNPRVGDSVKSIGDEMTRDIGTALYVAPELRSIANGTYSEKVDMYSLGIIFFEMCHPLKTGMERSEILGALRSERHTLPEEFRNPDRQMQGLIIESLVKHKPSERPNSSGLLRSGMLPVRIEDEQMRLALQSVSDPNSPYYHRMMSALFSQHTSRQIMEKMWAMGGDSSSSTSSKNFKLLQSLTKDKLVSIFRRHGAVETSRQGLIPRSPYYTNNNVAELLDRSGALVQLPFDLTLPFARTIAQQSGVSEKSYAFGMVFREASTGVAPRSVREADFDIVSYDTKDLALKEAEVIKVMDEILDEFPPFSTTPMCFHISHSTLIDAILEFCRVAPAQRQLAKEVLGKLNILPWTWQKIRAELRSPAIGISLTSLDELAQFDFRDTIEKTFSRLQSIFVGTPHLQTLHSIFTHISGLEEYLKRSGIRRKVYFSPLASFSDRFYNGNVMFQLLYDTKKRDVLAAGGRYDHLIEDHCPRLSGSVPSGFQNASHAVGVNIAWDRLVTSIVRYQKHAGSAFLKKAPESEMPGQWATRRCDVLVASFDSAALRSIGWKIVNDLWANDISAELAADTRAPEELLAQYREDRHSWIVIIKHEALASGKPDLKIKNMDKKEEADVQSTGLLNYLRGEIRERDQREGTNERAKLLRGSSHANGTANMKNERKGPVQVLMASHKSKKANKWRVVEAAHAKAQELVASFTDGPIASVETRDEILDLIRETRLSDIESWRKISQEIMPSEREYLWQIHELLDRFRMQYKDTTRSCFVYNFRTSTCIYYDLLL